MKNLFKRLFSGIVTIAVMSFSAASAFATDVETNDIEMANVECIELTATSEGITSINGEESPTGSLYGYAYGCLRVVGSPTVIIAPEGEGKSIIGLTVKMQSTWNGWMALRLFDGRGNLLLKDRAVYSNRENIIEKEIETNYTPNYVLNFNGIPDGVEVHTWVWIYS